MKISAAAAVLAFCKFTSASPIEQSHTVNSTLQWSVCDLDLPNSLQVVVDAKKEPLFCANLQVPLDYTNSKSERTVNLQLIKVKANKQPVKGTIFTQPGGPGGSGVEEVINLGNVYRDIFGGQWDVIAFDPRGTGRTIPFACNPVQANTSSIVRRGTNFTIPQTELYPILKNKAWHDGGLFVSACAETEGLTDYASYISTPFAARDMLSIVDALGEDGLLRLWGRSYGTVLGQTFAAMFPDRVGRIVLDSVVRLDDYYSTQWLSTHRDTEKVILNFFKECIAAGTKICPIANFTGTATTAESLQEELGNALQELLDFNLVLPDSYQPLGQPWWQPGITLYQELKYFMFFNAYRPDQLPVLYLLVEAALKRDWKSLISPATAENTTLNTTTPAEKPWQLGSQAFHGIACSDTKFRATKPEDMYALLKSQQIQASFLDVFGPQVWPCAQWPFKAREVFKGPYQAINTSYPLLFINSPQDPITSLSGAWEASANFMGSRLLIHNGHGHGSINHFSNCTTKAIHDYFNDGVLPELNTVCQPDKSAYEVALEAVAAANSTTERPEKRDLSNKAKVALARKSRENARQKFEARDFDVPFSF